MKRNFLCLLALLLLLALGACVGKTAAPAAPDESTPAPPAAPELPAETAVPSAAEPALRFATTTLGGEAADESLLAEASLTMVNFFEPWCPPCIAELPELEKLYETYAPEGFLILGVFSTEEGVDKVLADAAVSYPALRYVSAFDRFQTGYVPTTVFLDAAGRQVGDTVVGARSFAEWEAIVKELLG